MTSKSKRGAVKGKKAAGPAVKAKAESEVPEQVEEVSEEAKATTADEGQAAPPPEASTAAPDQAELQPDGKTEQGKPSEAEAEAIAEQMVVQARKPIKKNNSRSSLAGSVTVRHSHCTLP